MTYYTVGTKHEKPNLDYLFTSLTKLRKDMRSAAASWSKPTLRVYEVKLHQYNGEVTRFEGSVCATYYFDSKLNEFVWMSDGVKSIVNTDGTLRKRRK